MNRYHPALVILHWLLAVMIILGLIMGGNVLSETPNSAPQKLFYLRMHMSMGIIILVLMIIRLVIRVFSAKPPHADIGSHGLNIVGRATHYVFYLVVAALAASGLATANMAGLFGIVFGGSGSQLPASFDAFPPRTAHGILAFVLILLIAGHVLAFLYHQFIRKDELFSRMWLGGRE
ncbi:MAG: cytochrome b [Geminicoccales bacterium]